MRVEDLGFGVRLFGPGWLCLLGRGQGLQGLLGLAKAMLLTCLRLRLTLSRSYLIGFRGLGWDVPPYTNSPLIGITVPPIVIPILVPPMCSPYYGAVSVRGEHPKGWAWSLLDALPRPPAVSRTNGSTSEAVILSVCVCIHIYIYICRCICICICICRCIGICRCIYIYIYLFIHLCVCVSLCLRMCTQQDNGPTRQ